MTQTDIEKWLHGQTVQQRQASLYRFRRTVEGAIAVSTLVDGREVTVFCSNDYLGLASDPRLRAAATEAMGKYGLGAGASQLVTGHHRLHQELEEELADWLGRERTLLFSSGYLANMGVLQALAGREDHVVSDALNHASMIDGMRQSRAAVSIYRHVDVSDAEEKLSDLPASGKRLLVSDAVFSMDGDVAPLPELAALAQRQGAWFMADDAHGLGVIGPRGAGMAASTTTQELPVLTATLGKALGSAGAFVAGSEALIEYLIQRCRTLIYSTAPPPALAAAALVALRLARDDVSLREQLTANVARFRKHAAGLGLPLGNSTTPIQPLIIGEAARTMQISEALLQRGYLVTAIRPPTVPVGTARLRITLSAAHTPRQVDGLLTALSEVLKT